MFGSPHVIDWERLGRAVEFYRLMGYRYVEVPWAVPNSVTQMTLPPGAKPYSVGTQDLIGSAELAFLLLIKAGHLEPGKYVACSPCFRDEPVLDDLHQQRFMKVELIDTSRGHNMLDMLQAARHFMELEGAELVEVPQTDSRDPTWPQTDLEWNGIEMGSYGTRRVGGLEWTYGTGVSEPRFSYALRRATAR